MSDAVSARPTSQVSVRAHFERFPATVKGAFVIRGEDKDPHQVVVRSARVAGVAGEAEAPLPMPDAVLDVPPHQDVFVPFELSVGDLPPGWYGVECELDVDGTPGRFPGGKRFVVQWPRGSNLRGQVRVGKRLALGDRTVRVEQVDCTGDSVRVQLTVAPPPERPDVLAVRLSADGDPLDVLSVELDASGRGKVTAYPVPRERRALSIEVRSGRGRSATGSSIDVRLP